MALLAAFGASGLLTEEEGSERFLRHLYRILWITTVVVLIALTIPVLYGRPPIKRVAFLFANVFDRHLRNLYGFNWSMVNRATAQRNGQDYLEQLLGAEDLAKFF